MSSEIKLDGVGKSLKTGLKKLAGYRALLFFLLLAGIYGFIVYRINVLSSIAPDESAVPAVSKTTQPRIDPAVAQKITELQDNSVNVQKLFDEARNSPFRE